MTEARYKKGDGVIFSPPGRGKIQIRSTVKQVLPRKSKLDVQSYAIEMADGTPSVATDNQLQDFKIPPHKCPICKKNWVPSPKEDIFLPPCGCFGKDFDDAFPNTPCHECGFKHSLSCKKEKK
jgi:hypothetical protein